jgi:hypothetical protein
MGDWTAEELDRIGAADELTREVAFAESHDADHDAIAQAYRAKYAHYGSSYVDPMVTPDASAATLRLIAR